MKQSSKLKTELFILKARAVHGDKYDYSQVNFKGCNKKIKIVCKTHGVFEQIPSIHLSGSGCKFCGNNRLTKEQFIEKVNKIHKNKYDYSKTNFSLQTKWFDMLTIICPEHGEFYQRNDSHQYGKGCPKCARKNRAKSKGKKTVITKKKKQEPLVRNYILKVSYELKENPVTIQLTSNSFTNKADAENHQEEVKMFLDIIGGKIIESKVDVLPIIKQLKPDIADADADEGKGDNKWSLFRKTVAMPKFMRTLLSFL